MNELRETYAALLLSDHAIDYKRLSLSPYERFGKTWFQVHCDDYRDNFSKLYKDIEDAIDDFIKLKNKLYSRRK